MKQKAKILLLTWTILFISVSNYSKADNFKKKWASRLNFIGIVLEENDYHIWCTSPIWGNDGKVHLFVSRIPINHEDENVKKGFQFWYATSEIAHYVGLKPEGPYKFKEVMLSPGQSTPGSWDTGAQHNPSISFVDGKYVLMYHSNTSTISDRARKSHCIGMMTATNINGPWKKLGLILSPTTDTTVWSYKHIGGVDNPALLKNPVNGKYYLYYRSKYVENGQEINTYGVAISDKLEGPYKYYPKPVINNPRYVEDPFVFIRKGKIYMLVTDNFEGTGLLLSSKDGLFFDFNKSALGFDRMSKYIPDSVLKTSPNYHADKFERPQLLLKNGKPTYLFAPAGVNINNGNGTACYLLKVD